MPIMFFSAPLTPMAEALTVSMSAARHKTARYWIG
jgi:hypothetical protein